MCLRFFIVSIDSFKLCWFRFVILFNFRSFCYLKTKYFININYKYWIYARNALCFVQKSGHLPTLHIIHMILCNTYKLYNSYIEREYPTFTSQILYYPWRRKQLQKQAKCWLRIRGPTLTHAQCSYSWTEARNFNNKFPKRKHPVTIQFSVNVTKTKYSRTTKSQITIIIKILRIFLGFFCLNC